MAQPWNFSWFVKGKLAGMAYPSVENLAFLVDQGIKTLVNLSHRDHQRDSAAASHGIRVHFIDIDDFCPPTMDQIEEFLSIVENSESVSV